MARRTLGDSGATAVSLTYALLHYTLLVACETRPAPLLPQCFGG